ncbi:hypothetical protein [Treponema endosymbiont of Eucomonympha sp.]|nr:hypothetical protein [Treponema endosymbiont of Eucomonympha sp.]
MITPRVAAELNLIQIDTVLISGVGGTIDSAKLILVVFFYDTL